MLGEMLGKAVVQMALEGIERHVLLAGTIWLIAGGAQRSRHYQLVDAVALGRLEDRDCAAGVGIK